MTAAALAAGAAPAVAATSPSATVAFSPDKPLVGDTVTFTATVTPGSAPISFEIWDLNGDGKFDDGTGLTATHTFDAPGTYTVRFGVVDRAGRFDVETKTVEVFQPPTASFSFSPAKPGSGRTTTFTSTSAAAPGLTLASQKWDFNGDGTYGDATGASATRTFASPGSYDVGLQVTDSKGITSTVRRTVVVYAPPTAVFNFTPTAPVPGQQMTFTSSSTDLDGVIVGQAWSVDGGSFAAGTPVLTRSFAAGSHTVSLQVTDSQGLTTVVSRTFDVVPPPTASFDFSPAKPGSGSPVTFTSTSAAATGATLASQAWDLNGDGKYDDGTAATAGKTFATPGSYVVGLRVVDSRGIAATVQRTVVVYSPPTAAFGFLPAAPVPGQQVTFTSTSSDPDGQLVAQDWDVDGNGFNDGSGATLRRAFAAGTHTIRLRVTDSQGLVAIVSHTVDVAAAPTASFDFTPGLPGSGGAVSFTSTAGAAPGVTLVSQAWDLNGDGKYDDGTGATATKTFSTPGSYPVGLRVVDSRGIEAALRRTVVVYSPPTASFDFGPGVPNADQEITFTSTSTDVDGQVAALAWEVDGSGFADGTGPTLKRTLDAGSHTVRLRVTDSQGLTSVAEHAVVVAPRPIVSGPAEHAPTAAIAYSPKQPHVGDLVTLDAGAADVDGGALRAEWDLNGDGNFGDAAGMSATKAFDTPGPHPVAVRVTDAGGLSTIAFETVTVLPGSITPPGVLQWIAPFPIVRIAGSADRSLTRIRVLSVLTPGGTRVKASCSGRGCPRKPIVRTVRAGSPAALLRLTALERRWSAGTRIEISVTRTGFVGKFTRLVLQRLKPPTRVDRCVVPGHAKPMTCPKQP